MVLDIIVVRSSSRVLGDILLPWPCLKMVTFSLCPSHPSSSLKLYHSQFTVTTLSTLSGRKRRTSSCGFVVLSTHSNPKILKSNRRSRYGQPLSPYDDQEDDVEAYHFSDVSDDDWLLNVSSSLSLSLACC